MGISLAFLYSVFFLMRKRERTVGELLEKFEEIHLPTVSESTRTRYELDIRYRIRPHFERDSLSSIDRLKLESFRSGLLKELAPKSVNNCTELLRLIFNKGVDWGFIETSPMSLKKLRLPECKYKWWEDKEHITKFLAEAKRTPYYAAFLLALECGLRLGEIVGLSKTDIDLARCKVHVHQQWLEREGKLGPTKGRTVRTVNFDPKSDLGQALARAIAQSPDEEAIFVTRTGRRIRATKLRKLMPRLVAKAKVPAIRFHDLRHTFASWYMLEHDDIWTLMRLLGHADIQTTQRYAHLSAKNFRRNTLNWNGGDDGGNTPAG
jgi:integrase